MTEVKRHKFDALYNSYYGFAGENGIRTGATTKYTLFEQKYGVDDRELTEPHKMVAIQQEGNVVILRLNKFSDEFVQYLRRFAGECTDLAVNKLGAEEALKKGWKVE